MNFKLGGTSPLPLVDPGEEGSAGPSSSSSSLRSSRCRSFMRARVEDDCMSIASEGCMGAGVDEGVAGM